MRGYDAQKRGARDLAGRGEIREALHEELNLLSLSGKVLLPTRTEVLGMLPQQRRLLLADALRSHADQCIARAQEILEAEETDH